MKRTALLDGDILAYKQCARNEDKHDFGDGEILYSHDFDTVIANCKELMEEYLDNTFSDEMIVCLSDDTENWRNTVMPIYKQHRKGNHRPELLYQVKEWLYENTRSYRKDTLEADDVMGILSTHPKLIKGEKVIISEDKDMKTIPGLLYNPNRDEEGVVDISEYDADYFWMTQTITGDTTDGYRGLMGAGPAASKKALEGCTTLAEMWEVVLDLYQQYGYGPKAALQQARVARICRYTDYNFKERRVIPWSHKTETC